MHSTKKKYSDQLRAEALKLIFEQDLSIRKAAAQVGVPVATVEKWKQTELKRRRESGAGPFLPGQAVQAGSNNPSQTQPGSTSPPRQLPPNVEAGKVERSQAAGWGGAAAGAGAGGAEGARKAAGLGDDKPPPQVPPPGGGSPPPPPPQPQAPPIPPAMAIVGLSAVAIYLTTRTFCIKYKVPFDDQMKSMARMSPEEKNLLEEYAPYCAPLLMQWLQRFGPYIGAAIYMGNLWAMLDDRTMFIKEKSPMFDEDGKLKDEYKPGKRRQPPPRKQPQQNGPGHQAPSVAEGARVVADGAAQMAEMWKKMERGGQIPEKAPGKDA